MDSPSFSCFCATGRVPSSVMSAHVSCPLPMGPVCYLCRKCVGLNPELAVKISQGMIGN
jgi:hypothetical protein